MESQKTNRREVLKGLGAIPLVAAMDANIASARSAGVTDRTENKTARIGLIGVGNRGTSLLKNLLALGNVTIPAIADINSENITRAAQLVKDAKGATPALYKDGPEDFRKLLTRKDLDAVIIACPWKWHTPMAVAAMKAGKYVGVEVPAAVTVEDCWELVRTSESTGIWCMMLENVCYFRDTMQILNMVRQGQLGELLHCAGAYQHDSRGGSFDKDGNFPLTQDAAAANIGPHKGEQLWYTWYAWKENGNLYPTHPVGPIAQCLNIDRGDRFDYLVSVSSKARGLNKWVADHYGEKHPNASRPFALGDVNTTIIKSVNGATVTLVYDVQSPRPYDLGLRVQGTEGIYQMAPRAAAPGDQAGDAYQQDKDLVYIEGRSPLDKWEPMEKYREEFEHPMWRKLGAEAEVAGGHGGADYVMLHRFVACLLNRSLPEQDVYDAATWSVILPLTEQSVAGRGTPVEFPDFTAGKWKSRIPVPIITA